METFTPTLDWGNELWTSLVWIAWAWAIAAVCTLVILVLIGRYTTWGKQFWRITGAYFIGPSSVKVWLWLAVLLLFVIAGVRLDVLFSYQGNDMLTSLQVVAQGHISGNQVRERLWQGRLLAVHRRFLHHGGCARRADHAGFVFHAAVHAGVAGLAD